MSNISRDYVGTSRTILGARGVARVGERSCPQPSNSMSVWACLRACSSGFGAGQTFAQESDLAGMVRFVLANVEPFPIDIYLAGPIDCSVSVDRSH